MTFNDIDDRWQVSRRRHAAVAWLAGVAALAVLALVYGRYTATAAGVASAPASRVASAPTVKAPVRLANKTESDGTARQTAPPWTGSPRGPDGDFESPQRAQTLQIEAVMDAM